MKVTAIAVGYGLDAGARRQLAAMSIEAGDFPLDPLGSVAFAERRTERAISEALKAFAPHAVVASGPRTGLLGATLGKVAGADRVVLIANGLSALGLNVEAARKGWFGESGAHRRRKAGLAAADLVVFHNPDDPRRLIVEGLMPASQRHLVTLGSGVELAHYDTAPLPPLADGLVFLMLARLDKATGIGTFIDAATRVKAKAPGARFVLAGTDGRERGGLTAKHMAVHKAVIEHVGFVADVRPLIAAAHVIVHPSMSEGLPGAVLEALSAGRPVIASDIPGSRSAIDERVNGVLVPPGDADALAAAMESFLRRPDLIPAMARASRAKAERLFDDRVVVAAMLLALDVV